MNKKFSTLVATLLLSGALFSVQAAQVLPSGLDARKVEVSTGSIRFTADVDLEGDYLLISEDNVVVDGQWHTLKGSIVITGKGCTVKNLNIDLLNNGTRTDVDWSKAAYKNAITVAAESGTITNNTITLGATGSAVANGIVIFPTSAAPAFTVSGNTILNANAISGNNEWFSAGLILNGMNGSNTDLAGDNSLQVNVVNMTDTDNVAISDNSVQNSTYDIVEVNNSATTYMEVTPYYVDGTLKNAACIQELVTESPKTAIFNGTAAQFTTAMGETGTAGINVAVQCSDANVLYGTAQNPDNDLNAIIAGVTHCNATLFGYKRIDSETSEYAMLILRGGDGHYAIKTDDGGTASATKLTEELNNIGSFANNPDALWKMSRTTRADGSIYYEFVNQNGVVLKAAAGAGTGTNGEFEPQGNAIYNEGFVFPVNGLNLETSTPAYFALYRAGVNNLTVADLKWFEQDGFSTTIYYDYKNDGIHDAHLADNIAGNVFTGHLVPMAWDGNEDEFVEADATSTTFYLRNADGDYIVAQKYATNGSLIGQSTYSFTTVSATTLAKNLSRYEAGLETLKYYGEFHAEYSYAVTNPKTLEAIDALCVNVNGEYIKLGRLDLTADETPTLVASKLTELKPILISLGSNEVVEPWNLLKKGKFYTVELVSSTNDNLKNKKGYKLATEDDENNDGTWSPEFVKSYGNVLEGQFALTYEKNNNVYYYVLTNRENGNTYWIKAAKLYTTAKENEYRYKSEVIKITPVAEHSASDGYETRKDLKNQKFYIGFASGVFNTTAWFAENHSGNTNHVIGLDIDKENALMFTATEHAAARKVTEKNYRYTYHPSDSIYVISTLGYFDAKKNYKTTKDTLKLVSYSFVNQYGEPLVYNGNDDRLESSVDKTVAPQKFALRQDVNNKLNLRPVTLERTAIEEGYYHGADVMYQYLSGDNKLYAGDATNGMLSETWVYDRTENDLFVIEETAKPMYRKLANALDTVSIYRDTNAKEMLYEKAGFLGLDNTVQFDKIAPAMLADTAYVRGETYRPQYMLVVGPKVTPAGKWCETHQSATCEHAVPTKGSVEGRYLVNLKDTAIAWDAANKHKEGNPYVNTTSEKYYRLGFVQATHKDDVLAIAAAKPTAKDTIFVGDDKFNVAKFALRYVDQEAGSFVIETANYKTLAAGEDAGKADGEGYIKWMNGVVVVVPQIENAEIFNMNEDEAGNPTANEAIEATGVQVIGGQGAVTVQGAAGKVITVADILGRTIANQVAASDNVTIAVPAGIVVVAVEGEATKVVVK